MAATYNLISSQVLGSSAASVTFSSIPQTYTDLVIRFSVRTDYSSPYDFAGITFNGVTGTSYSITKLSGTGTAASSGKTSSAANMDMGVPYDGATATANTFANNEVYIPNYTSTSSIPVSIITMQENNTTAAYITATAALSRIGAAITSITFSGSSGNLVTGSSFYLYGIRNS